MHFIVEEIQTLYLPMLLYLVLSMFLYLVLKEATMVLYSLAKSGVDNFLYMLCSVVVVFFGLLVCFWYTAFIPLLVFFLMCSTF